MLAVLNRLGFPYNKMKAINRLLVHHNFDSSCFCLSSGFVKEVNSHSQLVLCYIILYKWLLIQDMEMTQHDKTNKMTCAPNEDSDHHVHPPRLIRVFAVRPEKVRVLSYQVIIKRRL